MRYVLIIVGLLSLAACAAEQDDESLNVGAVSFEPQPQHGGR